MVQMLNPGTAKIFLDCADQVVLPCVSVKLENTTHVDIVWRKCVRRRVVPSAVIPNIWKDFLRVDENQT